MRLGVGIVGLGPFWESRYLPALRALSDRFEVRAMKSSSTAHPVASGKVNDNCSRWDGFPSYREAKPSQVRSGPFRSSPPLLRAR